MATDDGTPTSDDIKDRIEKVGRYSRFLKVGLGVILVAFVLAVVIRLPRNLDSAASALDAVLMPLIFVGMGLLLFGIGLHLHLMHLNLVRQLRKGGDEDGGRS